MDNAAAVAAETAWTAASSADHLEPAESPGAWAGAVSCCQNPPRARRRLGVGDRRDGA